MINIILQSALLSFKRLFSAKLRSIFLRILLISFIFLFFIWFGLKHVFSFYFISFIFPILGHVPASVGWLGFLMLISLLFGFSHLLYILLCPLITFIGSFYADSIIEVIEKKDFAPYPGGTNMSLGQSISFSIRFFFLAFFGNILVLMLYFLPPLHLLGFYAVNGYIFGRIYFMLNALRFHGYSQAHDLFQKNWELVFFSGIVIAIISAIPLFGIIVPIFAPSFMAYIYKNIEKAKDTNIISA